MIVGAAPRKRRKIEMHVHAHYVTPGEVITTEQGFLRGHGTLVEDEKLIATVSGLVERVNKLISVRPLRSRYVPEVGDVVVGRVTEVVARRWKVNVGSRHDASLQLSAVHLPGNQQRRRTHEDALQMRQFYREDDVISAEVQSLHGDGSFALHTRSLKYGKLGEGQLVRVPPSLVKRCQHHFHTLPCGVDVIFGVNGFLWLSLTPPKDNDDQDNEEDAISEARKGAQQQPRLNLARVANAISVLAACFMSIHSESVMAVFESSMLLGLPPKDMTQPHNMEKLTSSLRDS